MVKAMLAEVAISLKATLSTLGNPCPPYSGSAASPLQPPSTIWR